MKIDTIKTARETALKLLTEVTSIVRTAEDGDFAADMNRSIFGHDVRFVETVAKDLGLWQEELERRAALAEDKTE